jgi:hypothetical protein
MLKVAGLVAAILAVWYGIDREWIPAAAWVAAAVTLTLAEVWWRSARSAWRGD